MKPFFFKSSIIIYIIKCNYLDEARGVITSQEKQGDLE